jgi:hypothetical protein
VTDARDDRRIQYLLDEMSQLDRAIFEDEFFTSDDEDDLLQAAEEDLIDGYCRGTLPSARRARFEERYLTSPEGRARVAFARWLMDAVAERQGVPRKVRRPAGPRTHPAVGWAAGLAAAAVLAFGATFLVGQLRDAEGERDRLRDTVARLQSHASEQDRRLAAMARDLGRVVSQAVAGGAGDRLRSATATVTAAPEAAASEPQRIALAPDVAVLRLEVMVGETAAGSYRGALRRDGRELWRQDGLQAAAGPRGTSVLCVIPAALVTPGRYVLLLGHDGPGPAAATELELRIERVPASR